jgi:hypothetical protein
MSNGFCTQCGHPLDAAEQHFCPACGAPLVAHTPPEPGPQTVDSVPATEDLAGRNCPYCRFPLKAGGAVHHCPSCHAVHHTECWQENGGCAIASCASGPSSHPMLTAPTVVHTPVVAPMPVAAPTTVTGAWPTAPPAAYPGAVGPPPPAPAVTARRVSLGAVVIVAAVLIALGGSATALVLSSKNKATASEQASADATTDAGADPATQDTTTADTTTDDGLDGSSADGSSGSEGDSSQTDTSTTPDPQPAAAPTLSPATKVERAVKRHWRYIESGDYYAAFDLLSPSLQSTSGGAANWVSGHVQDHITSVDVEVEARDVMSTTAVADIITLRTRARATGCKVWSGYYQMVKAGGRWRIDKAKLTPAPC